MKPFKILLLVNTIVAFFMTGCRHEDDIHITFIGNSCIERWDLNRYFPTLITTNLGLSNTGVENIERYAGTLSGQRVVILTGSSELSGMLRAIEEDSLTFYMDWYIERYVNAIDALRADRVYVNSIPPQGKERNSIDNPIRHNVYAQDFNRRIYEAISVRGWKWVDIFPLMFDGDVLNPAYSDDGIHPNDVGYEIMTQQLMQNL